MAKSEQLQIRVSVREKERLRQLAAAAGQDISTYVLDKALPPAGRRFQELLELLRTGAEVRYVLAELNDLLAGLEPPLLHDAVAQADLGGVNAYLQNYVAAMVEQACARRAVDPPAWTLRVEPLVEPHFAAPLASLRLHLLRTAPVVFKRRNIFVDATVGDRV